MSLKMDGFLCHQLQTNFLLNETGFVCHENKHDIQKSIYGNKFAFIRIYIHIHVYIYIHMPFLPPSIIIVHWQVRRQKGSII